MYYFLNYDTAAFVVCLFSYFSRCPVVKEEDIWRTPVKVASDEYALFLFLTSFFLCWRNGWANQLLSLFHKNPSFFFRSSSKPPAFQFLPKHLSTDVFTQYMSKSSQTGLSNFIAKTSETPPCPSDVLMSDPTHPSQSTREAQQFHLCDLQLCLLSFPHSHCLQSRRRCSLYCFQRFRSRRFSFITQHSCHFPSPVPICLRWRFHLFATVSLHWTVDLTQLWCLSHQRQQ